METVVAWSFWGRPPPTTTKKWRKDPPPSLVFGHLVPDLVIVCAKRIPNRVSFFASGIWMLYKHFDNFTMHIIFEKTVLSHMYPRWRLISATQLICHTRASNCKFWQLIVVACFINGPLKWFHWTVQGFKCHWFRFRALQCSWSWPCHFGLLKSGYSWSYKSPIDWNLQSPHLITPVKD